MIGMKETEIMQIGPFSIIETVYGPYIPAEISIATTIFGAPGYSDEIVEEEITREQAIKMVEIFKKHYNI